MKAKKPNLTTMDDLSREPSAGAGFEVTSFGISRRAFFNAGLAGAAVVGMIGGSSGARTGAKVGAVASVITRGGSINIPACTLLDFTLAAPFTP